MPFLPKVFSKKDKPSTNLDAPNPILKKTASNSSQKSSDYVLPGRNIPPDRNGDDSNVRVRSPSPSRQFGLYDDSRRSVSSSRLKMTVPGFRRKGTAPDQEPTSPRNSLSLGSSSLELPPSRSSLFNAFGRSGSSQSLPNDASKNSSMAPQLPPLRIGEPVPKRPPALTTQTLPVPKTPEMRTSSTIKVFNRGSKPTKMSDAPRLDLNIPSSSTQDTLDSFSLKSFRPVRPISPAPPNALGMDLSPGANNPSISPSGLFPPSPIPASSRSRGGSVGSENSPKITVAQFRQAQMESAKNRSSVHLPVPEHPSDSMPPGNVPLHVNLVRPISPAFSQGKGGNASGNESGGDHGTPSRPARLLPPQTLGRSSPVPRAHTPVTSSPIARSPMSQTRRDGPRMSANWMLTDSDSESSEDTASGEAAPRQAGRPTRKPPLIPDFQNMKSPLPSQTETTTSPYPSSFASTSRSKAALSASQSDLGHSSSSTTRPQHPPQPNPSPRLEATPNRSALTPSSSPQNIRPGEYSAGGSPSARSPQTVESVDTWSNTHSQVHSRQGSHDRIQNYRGTSKSELGHGALASKPAAVRGSTVEDRTLSASTSSNKPSVTRSLSANVLSQKPSSFGAATKVKTNRVASSDSETEDPTSEDDAPLSSLVPPRRPGSAASSLQGGSPASSFRNIPPREQSPARSTRSAGALTPRTSPQPPSASSSSIGKAGGQRGSTPSPVPDIKDTTSPLSRGRRPTLDEYSSSPKATPSANSPLTSSPIAIPPREATIKSSLLTPPMSEIDLSTTLKTAPKSSFRSPATTTQAEASNPPSFLKPASNTKPSSFQRGQDHLKKPFTREESPASSVGYSSISSRIPATPRTGSDVGIGGNTSTSAATSSSGSSANDNIRKTHGKRLSVTFDEPVAFPAGKSLHRREASGNSASSSRRDSTDLQATKRNERRRSEAKAAIEFGKVVNGPPPPVDSDEEEGLAKRRSSLDQVQNWNMMQNMAQTQQMQAMAMGMGGMGMGMAPGTPGMQSFNMNPGVYNPMMSMNMPMVQANPMFNSMMPNGMGMPPGFTMPPVPQMPNMNMMMGVDPSMMAAHHQAMMIAKQAYQMAVAQQAIAAAGDEWERSSNMGGFSGMSNRPPTLFGMPTGSVYGGSTLGLPTMGTGSVWGGSVYGDAFGPSQVRTNHTGVQPFPGSGLNPDAGYGNDALQPRKRTMTAPSSALPPAHLRGAGAPPLPPPSSWRAS